MRLRHATKAFPGYFAMTKTNMIAKKWTSRGPKW